MILQWVEVVIGNSNFTIITDRLLLSKMEHLILSLFLLRIKLELIMYGLGTLMICGEAVLLINVLEIISMAVRDFRMGIIISIRWWVAKLRRLIRSSLIMGEFRLERNCLREIGYGLLSGSCQDITNMGNGLQVEKLISWKVEEMLTILNNLEEVLIVLDLLFIGDLTGLIISTIKLMLRNLYQVQHLLTISIFSVFIGTTRPYIPILIMKQTKFFK